MKVKELKKELALILNDAYSVQVYFVLKNNNDFELRLADFDNKDTITGIKKLFEERINEKIISNEEIQLRKLSLYNEMENTVYLYDYDEYPEEIKILVDFNLEKEQQERCKFSLINDQTGSIFGYIVCLGTQENKMILFKKHYPIFLIKMEKSIVLNLINGGNRIKKLENENLLRFNGDFQLLRFKDEIFVFDVKMLERNMGFTRLIQNQAIKAIQEVKKLDIIEDIEVLKDSLEDISFARKLATLYTNSEILRQRIPKDVILKFTKENPSVSGKFKYTADGKHILLDTKKSRKEFLKLMNDAYLHSELTKIYYEALAKDRLE